MTNEFDFLGFEPSIRLECFANLGLARILETAPPRTRSDAYLIKVPEGEYEASIKLNSYRGDVTRSVRGGDAFSVITCLCEKVMDDLVELASEAPLCMGDRGDRVVPFNRGARFEGERAARAGGRSRVERT
jgi:hypothetical protein